MKRAELAKTHIKKIMLDENNYIIKVNEEICRIWWKKFNIAMFDEKLNDPIRFECSKFICHWGWCLPWRKNSNIRRVRLGIHSNPPFLSTFIRILAHEMIHQSEWELDKQPWCNIVNHEETFHIQAQRFLKELEIDVIIPK